MQVTPLFSTPILETTLDFVDSSVLESVRQLPFELTPNKCCEYSVSKKIHKNPLFVNLFSDIKKVADVYATGILGYDLTSSDLVIDLKTSWAIKMKPGDFAGSHYHAQSLFTGIFYLNVDKNESNKLNFINPHTNNSIIDMYINNWNIHNCQSFFVTPTTNKLIFFPSNINHSADINQSNEDLYSLVFDFFPRGIMAKNTTSELILNW